MSKEAIFSNYEESTKGPTKHPDELKVWWQRIIAMAGYRPYKVKVLKREQNTKTGLVDLTFILAEEEAEPGRKTPPREFPITVPSLSEHVWTDLPSTAQLALPGDRPYGFLFLTDEWAHGEGVNLRNSWSADGGGKWPIGTDDIERVLLAMQEETARKKLIDVLDAHTLATQGAR